MDPSAHLDAHATDGQGISSQPLSPAPVITPTKPKSKGLLADIPFRRSYPDMHIQASGSENNGGPHQSGKLPSEMPSGTVQLQMSSHLPTPQSPRYMPSYLLTGTPSTAQNLQPDLESIILPTEFRSNASSPPPSIRPHSIPTPEASPSVTRFRTNGSHSLSQIAFKNQGDDGGSVIPSKRDIRSRSSTPPRTPSRQTFTRPVTPVFQSRPITPLQGRPISPEATSFDNLQANGSTASPPLHRVKDEPGGEAARIRAHLIENHPASTQAAKSRQLDYLKRMRRLAPSSNPEIGDASLTSDLGGKERSLSWTSANVGIIDSPVKGKRIALFQETSEESFEESLMAGGYGRYRSDKPFWKLNENAESPNQLGDSMAEGGLGSGLILTEEDKRKKTRLAAFFDPPRASSTQLFPVEIEGCGRVLVKVEPSEPQTPPKPTPKARRSRKRKKVLADTKQDTDKNIASPEDRAMDEPNWPDTEFPWRSHLMQDGLSIAEREKRVQYIESFLDRDSDEDDVDEPTSSRRHSPDVSCSRSHSKDLRRGLTTLSAIPGDPADAKAALLSKKSIRAVQLRLLRRRNTSRAAKGDDDETLCICQGQDDGRPLVQCDACRMWYHLECIGILSTSELGREEDPWFCANCVDVKTPSPVTTPLAEPTLVPTDDGEHGSLEEYNPPFFNSGFHPPIATPWTKSMGPPMTPPHLSGSSWEEPPSSSSRRDPRTPQFNTSSVFEDMVQVYSTTPGRSLEPLPTRILDEMPFDPTSTPSRGIRFGLPFTTPKDGRWGSPSWHGMRGGGCELFHTPNRPSGEDGTSRHGVHSIAHSRVGENLGEGSLGAQGLYRMTGPNNVTPVERNAFGGPKRMHMLESPLGAKRSRRTVDS